MKLSIIVPLTDDQGYLDSLRSIIQISLPQGHSYELVLVKEFDPSGLHKVAEKPEAQLFMYPKSSLSQKFEAGAFQAKGDIFYFLMPGYLPPFDFASRIIKACENDMKVGTIPGKWLQRFCWCFSSIRLEKIVINLLKVNNLMISRTLFSRTHGFRWDGKDRSLNHLMVNALPNPSNTILIS